MDRRRLITTLVVIAVLALLVYMQVRTWRGFDWTTFWEQTQQSRKIHIVHAIALIYLAYALRSVRWQLFLRPAKQTSWLNLLRPTIIGFTGLALLGRPGEFIRPYLIARRENLPFSSQIAVWTVERIFDLGAFTVLMVAAIFFMAEAREFTFYSRFREAGYFLVAIVAAMTLTTVLVARYAHGVANWLERRLSALSATLARTVASKVREFGLGLNTIQNPLAFLMISVVSIAMWYTIAIAYREVTHSYVGTPLQYMTTPGVLLLMGSSMVGSILQLPAVGGGSQLATIAALYHVFEVPRELAVSCGMLLWLVTFMAVVPLGLLLAHQEHLSLRRLSAESARAGEAVLSSLPPDSGTA
jgi:uncharacterized protein (TIRG00374 family)